VTIVIPKGLRSFEFTELTLVDLNDVDIDRLLPQLWELIVKQGRQSNPLKDADDYNHYLDALATDKRMVGFEDEQGKRVLDGWLRSSVVRIGAKGRTKTGTQMAYIQPLTIASYRAGLPKVRRNRNADTLIYRLLTDEMELRGWKPPQKPLRQALQKAVGAGVDINVDGQWQPSYNGHEEIDVNALLSLYFLEEFTMGGLRKDPGFTTVDSAVPSATRGLANDLLDYLTTYGGQLPPAAFVDRFAALISLRLFQLPLRIARAARHVITTSQKSADMQEEDAPNPLALYCDFTRIRGSASDELARQCVQRDMEITRGFLSDRLLLRSLREAMGSLKQKGEEIKGLRMPDRLIAMIAEKEDLRIGAYANYQMDLIEKETHEDASGTPEDLAFISEVKNSEAPPVEQLAALLVEALSGVGLKNQVKWFWNTGGIQKPYGLLMGSVNSRRSWRYAPSDDLLNAILLVCFTHPQDQRPKRRMPIKDLLDILDKRFGILIDRPPADFDSADNRAAAGRNFEAFKRRLRLLGCFDGLSDDFSAQYVSNPVETA
jgi:hypothetical protein